MVNNHLVSRVYLKNFEDKTLNKLHLSEYKLINGSYKWSYIKSKNKAQICYLIDCYDCEAEDLFQIRFEKEWDNIIKHLSSINLLQYSKKHIEKKEIFTDSQIEILLHFLIIHYKRSTRVMERNKTQPAVIENLKKYQKALKRDLTQNEIKDFHKDVNNNLVKEPQEKSMEHLKKLLWLIYVNNSSTPFITSNIPVIWHNEMNKIGIFAPISPIFSILIPVIQLKEKNGLIVENITSENVRKFNNLMKLAVIKENPKSSLLISNKKDTLEDLINY